MNENDYGLILPEEELNRSAARCVAPLVEHGCLVVVAVGLEPMGGRRGFRAAIDNRLPPDQVRALLASVLLRNIDGDEEINHFDRVQRLLACAKEISEGNAQTKNRGIES